MLGRLTRVGAPLAKVALAIVFPTVLVLTVLVVTIVALPGTTKAADDPGLILDLDRDLFELSTFDARSGEAGPRVRVVLGSPANDTPNGDHPVGRVILNPSWHPSDAALGAGAVPVAASLDSPMGVAKIPFANTGSIALHGGGDLLLLGKPVSGGCVRARDADLLRIIAWLMEQGALSPPAVQDDGEVHRSFQRPVRLRIHGTLAEID